MEDCDEGEDPFDSHFKYELSPHQYTAITSEKKNKEKCKIAWPALGDLIFTSPNVSKSDEMRKSLIEVSENYVKIPGPPSPSTTSNLRNYRIKSCIVENSLKCNLVHVGESNLSPLQLELLSLMHEYRDVYFTQRTFSNAEQLRFVYCLHAINHALKVRKQVTRHNAKIADDSEIPDEYRDQGWVRPRILILVPFKDSALRAVKMLSSILLGEEKQNIVNKKRFYEDFGGDHVSTSQKRIRPEDYEQTFAGNIDDSFKMGIQVSKKSLKLYADFYSSDIIIASPLGLRMIIKTEGEADRDYDFLSSIELLIVDQTEVLLMQNWDHVLHVLEHLNLKPAQTHDTDISRIRPWAIDQSKYYRQNIIFTAYPLLQISAMVSDIGNNFAGCVATKNVFTLGCISQVVVPISQIFHRINVNSASEAIDERFNAFLRILSHYRDNLRTHVLVYVPSYFDFVRLRNHFKTEAISFVPVCEYSKDKKVAQARDMFFHNEVNYMLYSERFHFFMRRKIRGIRHIIFYQPPTIPHFYSEMCNLLQDANQNPKYNKNSSKSISVIYSKYDFPQLQAIVSTNRAARMFSSNTNMYVFETENS